MSLRILLTASIVLGMHTSLCSGGIFALATSTVDAIAYTQQEREPMSYGSIGYLSCKNAERSEAVGAIDMNDCGNTAQCITQLSSKMHDALVLASIDTDASNIDTQFCVSEAIDLSPSMMLARAGPLYEDALSVTRSVVQRK